MTSLSLNISKLYVDRKEAQAKLEKNRKLEKEKNMKLIDSRTSLGHDRLIILQVQNAILTNCEKTIIGFTLNDIEFIIPGECEGALLRFNQNHSPKIHMEYLTYVGTELQCRINVNLEKNIFEKIYDMLVSFTP